MTRPDAPAPRRNRILAVLLISIFMTLTQISILNVALPSIEADIGASPSQLQWVLSGYALVFGLMLVAMGRLGDQVGRERLFLVGLTVFISGAVVATVAPTPAVLIAGRMIMGLGAGIFNPQTTGLIQQNYRGAERAGAFSKIGSTVGIATAIGPVVGGLLIGALPAGLGWRSTVALAIPIGLVAWVLGRRWLPRTARDLATPRTGLDLDPVGMLLLGAAVVCVMVPFTFGSLSGGGWWVLVLALGLGIAWVGWELHYKRAGRAPMVDMRLFRIGTFTRGVALIGVFFTASTTVWVLVAQFVQHGLGRSALVAGLLSLPASVMVAVAAQIAGRQVIRIGRWIVVIGLTFSLTGLLAAMAVVPGITHGTLPLIVLGVVLMLIGFGNGMVTSPNQALTLQDVPVRHGGTAGGIMQTGQRLGTAIGTTLVLGLYYNSMGQGADVAFRHGYTMIAVVFAVTLVLGVVDAMSRRKDSAP